MLAEIGYKTPRGLKPRINAAVEDKILPFVMGKIADSVRVVANQAHTDEEPEEIPSEDEAKQAFEFARLLADYLFVLPARMGFTHPTKDSPEGKPAADND